MFSRLFSFLALAAGCLGFDAALTDTPIYAPNGIALGGYDAVAYVVTQQATEGKPAHSYRWKGVEWHFSSQDHRDLFVRSPEAFAPLFGGFCALGVAHGALVPSNPRAWTLHEGRLVLNQSDLVAETWRYNPELNLRRAEAAYADAQKLYEKWQRRAAEQRRKSGQTP